MKQTPGASLGPYQIVSAIGAGGMGDVFKATDTRLNRTVARRLTTRATRDSRPTANGWRTCRRNRAGRKSACAALQQPAEKHQVSAGGGNWPRWRRDGKELFYVSKGKVMSVTIESEPVFSASVPRTLFDAPTNLTATPVIGIVDPFDVAPDGQRFLFAPTTLNPAEPVSLIVNWPALLKK